MLALFAKVGTRSLETFLTDDAFDELNLSSSLSLDSSNK